MICSLGCSRNKEHRDTQKIIVLTTTHAFTSWRKLLLPLKVITFILLMCRSACNLQIGPAVPTLYTITSVCVCKFLEYLLTYGTVIGTSALYMCRYAVIIIYCQLINHSPRRGNNKRCHTNNMCFGTIFIVS